MKRILLLTAVFATVLLTSCSKIIIEGQQQQITGSWVLLDAAHKDQYGWYTETTGVERGVFTFYTNGTATYTEKNVTMDGHWSIRTEYDGYYDEYGDYYTNAHQSLEIHVADYHSDDQIDMSFDNVRFNGSTFVATNYNSNYIERYKFGRY